ncbi:MAG: hypothetical protein II458_07680, partial [Oscillospiraceae bacterium]|nr:hypothetical protein [Oscillospiraceae bacterium]
MRKHLRRLLSMLLVLTMVTSFVVTGWAVDGNGGSALNGSGTELELENLDPGTLHIPKLGEVADGEVTAEQPVAISPTDIVRVSIFLNSPAALDAGYSMEGVGTNRAAVNYRDSLRRQQADVTAAIEKALNSKLDVKWNLTLAANAISAEVRYMD